MNKDKESIEKFNEINEAYRTLGDLDNRLKYSLLLHKRDEILAEKALANDSNGKKNDKKKK
jgi:curved DNA-binding protein CbpA